PYTTLFRSRPLQTTQPTGGYVRTAYWDNYLNLSTFQQIAPGVVRFKCEEYDGAGRVRRKANDHPSATVGKYAGQQTIYDQGGRPQQVSTVIAINWDCHQADEDAPLVGLCWVFGNQTYDEMNWLVRLTYPDSR